MNDHPYMESPSGVKHRFWKHLGPVYPTIDVAYAIAGMHGDMDPDREAELRGVALGFIYEMRSQGRSFVEGATAEIPDWPARGRLVVLGFTSTDPAISQHIYRQLAAPRH